MRRLSLTERALADLELALGILGGLPDHEDPLVRRQAALAVLHVAKAHAVLEQRVRHTTATRERRAEVEEVLDGTEELPFG